MPTVTLKSPRTYTIGGTTFRQDEPKAVDAALARQLKGNAAFQVDWKDAGVKAARRQVNGAAEVAEEPAEAGPEETALTLREAIDSLGIDEESDFDVDGKPSLAALSAIMGREITADERDRVLRSEAGTVEVVDVVTPKARIVRRADRKADASTEGAVAI